jgi:hypothetical protein
MFKMREVIPHVSSKSQYNISMGVDRKTAQHPAIEAMRDLFKAPLASLFPRPESVPP